MKKSIFFAISLTLLFLTLNCSGNNLYVYMFAPGANTNPTREYASPYVATKGGFFFHKNYIPGTLGLNAEGTSEGKGCSHSILSLFAFGDSSIESAKKAGNITKIAYVDYEHLGILAGHVYHRVCTIVKGS